MDKITVHLNVLGPGVEDKILDVDEVVVVDCRRIRHLHLQTLRQMASHVVTTAPGYLALVLDSATVGCFLLLQVIATLPSENIETEVDLGSPTFLAQSVSM